MIMRLSHRFFYKMGAIMRKLKMADTFQEEKAEKKK